MQKDLVIFSAGTSLGSFSDGAEDGPTTLLDRGLEGVLATGLRSVKLQQWGADRKHVGADRIENVRNARTLVPWLLGLRAAIIEQPSDAIPLVLGGDHAVATSSLLATRERHEGAVCVYIDAHPDVQAPGTSLTHNLHGMPVRIATGGALQEHFHGPYWSAKDIFYLAIKDIDQAEFDWIQSEGVRHATMDDITSVGIGEVMRQVRAWIAGRPVHVSYDIDAVDCLYAPGTGIQNNGGLTYREAAYIARQLAYEQLVALDLVEFNPQRDTDSMTADLSIELIAHLLGVRWDRYTRYLHHA